MNKKFLSFLLYFICHSAIAQHFQINIYELNNDILSFSHLKYSFTENGIKITKVVSNKTVYKCRKINDSVRKELMAYIAFNTVNNMDSIFRQRPIMSGGIVLTFELTINNSKKVIYFSCYQVVLDNIIRILNKLLPKRCKIYRFTFPCKCSYPSNPCELLKSD